MYLGMARSHCCRIMSKVIISGNCTMQNLNTNPNKNENQQPKTIDDRQQILQQYLKGKTPRVSVSSRL